MNKKPRVSAEQRQFMLQFMMGHEDLAKGRVSGADASRRRGVMLQELASASFSEESLKTARESYTMFVELPQEGLQCPPEVTPTEKEKKKKNHNDEKLNNILERQAAALERLAALPDAINNLAEALKTGLQSLASRTPPPN